MSFALHDSLRDHLLDTPQRADLIPPPRFTNKTFANYRVNAEVDGLAEALEQIQAFALAGKVRWWQLGRNMGAAKEKRGLYLDGDFGVGKTHLLAALYNDSPGTKSYVSFAEAISLCVILSPEKAAAHMAADMVCIDEFELDDPSNTRLADLLVHHLVALGCRIAVTSNTVPGELGQGRMSVDKFRNQLVRIADTFADVHVPGADFRRQQRSAQGANPPYWGTEIADFEDQSDGHFSCTMAEFDALLMDIPLINLRRLAQVIRRLYIRDVVPCNDQLIALRFVHAIDKLYDYEAEVRIQSSLVLEDIFLPEYRDWAFAKKYRRCTSRLSELCAGKEGL